MTKIEMDAENDKTTKNFDRYKFTNGTVCCSFLNICIQQT